MTATIPKILLLLLSTGQIIASLANIAPTVTPSISPYPTLQSINDTHHSRHDTDCPSHLSNDPLSCWLYGFKLDLPDADFDTADGLLTFHLSKFYCTHFELGGLDSQQQQHLLQIEQLLSNQQNSTQSYAITLENLYTTCTGHYHVAGTHGSIKASTYNTSNLALTLTFTPDADGYYCAMANITQCSNTLEIDPSTLHFSGAITGTIANAFKGSITKYVNQQVQKGICDPVQVLQEVDEGLTKGLQSVNEVLEGMKGAEGDQEVDPRGYYVDIEEAVDWSGDVPYVYVSKGLMYLNEKVLGDKMWLGVVNGLVRGWLGLGPEGGVVYANNASMIEPMTLELPQYGTIIVECTDIRLDLHNKDPNSQRMPHLFTSLQILNPIPSSLGSFLTQLTLAPDTELALHTNLSITTQDIHPDNNPLVEHTTLSLSLQDVSLALQMYMGLHEQHLEELGVGVSKDYPMCAVAKSLEYVRVQDLKVEVQVKEVGMKGSGGLEGEIDQLVNTLAHGLLEQYSGVLGDAVYNGMQGYVRQLVNHNLMVLVDALQASQQYLCPNVDSNENGNADSLYPPHQQHYLPWSSSKVMQLAEQYLTPQNLRPIYATLNTHLNDYLAGVYHNYISQYKVDVEVMHVHLQGMQAVDTAGLHNDPDGYGSLGWYTSNTCHGSTLYDVDKCGHQFQPLTFSFDTRLEYTPLQGSDTVVEWYNSTVTLGSLSSQLYTRMLVDMSTVYNLTLHQAFHSTPCRWSTVDSLELKDAELGVGLFRVDVEGDTGNVKVAREGATSALNATAIKMAQMVTENVEKYVDMRRQVGELVCRTDSGHLDYDNEVDLDEGQNNEQDSQVNDVNDNTSDGDGACTGIILTGIGVGIVIILALWLYQRRRTQRQQLTMDVSPLDYRLLHPTDETNILNDDENNDNEIEEDDMSACLTSPLISSNEVHSTMIAQQRLMRLANSYSSSLLCNTNTGEIPCFIRYFIPLWITATIVLFAVSNSKVGATVDAVLGIASHGEQHEWAREFESKDPVYEFSLISIIEDMWHAKTYFLLLLIFTMSVMVPYVKLLLMLYAWCAPHGYLHPKGRERLLVILEAVGKYALVDAFVLVIMLVAFRYDAALYLGDYEVDIDVYVNPQSGFYCFLIATISSIVLGHVVLFFHRHTCKTSELPDTGPFQAMGKHVFQGAENRRVRFSRRGILFIDTIILLTGALIGVGVTLKSFEFQFYGLAGLVLEDPDRSYSLLTIGHEIPTSVQNAHSIGSTFIQICYFFFGVITPYTFLVLTLLMLKVPMQVRSQKFVFAIIEIAFAWSALEVFLISMVAGLAEISDIASYIVGDLCDDLDKFLENSDFFDMVLDGHDTCFDVEAHLHGSSWVLILGVIVNLIVTFYLIRIMHQALDERVKKEGIKRTTSESGRCSEAVVMDLMHHATGNGSMDDHIGMVKRLDGYPRACGWLFDVVTEDDSTSSLDSDYMGNESDTSSERASMVRKYITDESTLSSGKNAEGGETVPSLEESVELISEPDDVTGEVHTLDDSKT